MCAVLLTKKELQNKLYIPASELSNLLAQGMPKEGAMFDFDQVIKWREALTKNMLGYLEVGKVFTNNEIVEKFRCSSQGGMRRSHKTNTLVLFSDQTGNNIYKDKWIEGILQYTGMGLTGNQELDKSQNKILANSKTNFVNIHLFETFKPKEHTYLGEVYLANDIYISNEPDSVGNNRQVYKFPLALKIQDQLIEDKEIYNNVDYQIRDTRKLSDSKIKEEAENVSKYNEENSKKIGNKKEFCFSKTKVYKRNIFISEYIKRLAKGVCQLCQEEAPFENNGVPYLHCHHIDYLSNGGKDVIGNCIALCPNCHARVHVLELQEDKQKLFDIVRRRVTS